MIFDYIENGCGYVVVEVVVGFGKMIMIVSVVMFILGGGFFVVFNKLIVIELGLCFVGIVM